MRDQTNPIGRAPTSMSFSRRYLDRRPSRRSDGPDLRPRRLDLEVVLDYTLILRFFSDALTRYRRDKRCGQDASESLLPSRAVLS